MNSFMMPSIQQHVKAKVPHKKRQSKTTPRKKRWTKPEGMPKRPLSAYNLFFQHERGELLKAIEAQRRRSLGSGGLGIGFGNLARHIAEKWKHLDDSSRCIYDAAAKEEKRRYQRAVDDWRQQAEKSKEDSFKRTSFNSPTDSCEFFDETYLVTSMDLDGLAELNDATASSEDGDLFNESHDKKKANEYQDLELESGYDNEFDMNGAPSLGEGDLIRVLDEPDETLDTLGSLTKERLAKHTCEEYFEYMSNYSASLVESGAMHAPKEQQLDRELMHMLNSLQQLHAQLDREFDDFASKL